MQKQGAERTSHIYRSRVNNVVPKQARGRIRIEIKDPRSSVSNDKVFLIAPPTNDSDCNKLKIFKWRRPFEMQWDVRKCLRYSAILMKW